MLKKKNHTIMSISADKAFEKLQHSSIIKTFSNLRIEELPQLDKCYLQKKLQLTSYVKVWNSKLSH